MPIVNLPPNTPAPTGMQQMMDKMKQLQEQAAGTGGASSAPADVAEADLKARIADDTAQIKEAKAELKAHKAEGNFSAQILDQYAINEAKADRAQARLQLKDLKAQPSLPTEPS